MDGVQALNPFLYEGQTMPAAAWQEKLHIADSIFRSFIADGIFVSSSAQTFRLNFVGILFTGREAFTVLPKIFYQSTKTINISLQYEIVACVRRYIAGISRRTKYAEASEILSLRNEGAKLIDIFLSLIDWTLDRGMHSEQIDMRSPDSPDIDWAATMRDSIPLHIGNTVIYSEIASRETATRSGPLAQLQAKALLSMHQALQPASLFWLNENDAILEMAAYLISSFEENDPDSIDTEAGLLEYMSRCNQDHDKELAGIIFEWMSNVSHGIDRPTSFGTTAFEYVWEDMCEEMVGSLGVSMSHQELASQPLYIFSDTNKKTQGQRPDILRQLSDGIVILDAKWYDVAHQDWPGTQDVIKQMVYQVSLAEDLSVIRNAFLVPTHIYGHEIIYIGKACMTKPSQEKDKRFPQIDILAVPWNLAYTAYCGTTNKKNIAASILRPNRNGKN